VPVCIAIPMADVSSIEPCNLRATPARSVSSGAMDAVARMFKTIRLSRRGPMLRADACTPGAWEGDIELVDIGQRVCRAYQARLLPANATSALRFKRTQSGHRITSVNGMDRLLPPQRTRIIIQSPHRRCCRCKGTSR
jgi:hypothetical protein